MDKELEALIDKNHELVYRIVQRIIFEKVHTKPTYINKRKRNPNRLKRNKVLRGHFKVD